MELLLVRMAIIIWQNFHISKIFYFTIMKQQSNIKILEWLEPMLFIMPIKLGQSWKKTKHMLLANESRCRNYFFGENINSSLINSTQSHHLQSSVVISNSVVHCTSVKNKPLKLLKRLKTKTPCSVLLHFYRQLLVFEPTFAKFILSAS